MLLTSPPCRSLVIYRTKHNGSEDDIPPICSPPRTTHATRLRSNMKQAGRIPQHSREIGMPIHTIIIFLSSLS